MLLYLDKFKRKHIAASSPSTNAMVSSFLNHDERNPN